MTFSTLLVTLALAGVQPEHPAVTQVKSVIKDESQPITMLVSFTVKDGMAEKFKTAALACAAETAKEKGCITYQLSRDVKNPNSFVMYERWKNLDGLKEHLTYEHTKKLLGSFPDMLEGAIDIKILAAIEK